MTVTPPTAAPLTYSLRLSCWLTPCLFHPPLARPQQLWTSFHIFVMVSCIAFFFVCGVLVHVIFCRRRIEPHLTSVVDPDDVVEGGVKDVIDYLEGQT